GLRPLAFCWIEIDGARPVIESTSGLGICPRNWRGEVGRGPTYPRRPPAYSGMKAREPFPAPPAAVMTINWFFGSRRLTSRRLCSRAPRMTMSDSCMGSDVAHDQLKYETNRGRRGQILSISCSLPGRTDFMVFSVSPMHFLLFRKS